MSRLFRFIFICMTSSAFLRASSFEYTSKEDLQKLLSFKTELVQETLAENFERVPRPIRSRDQTEGSYGLSFPINPEALVFLIKHIQTKEYSQVLDLAAGDGAMGLILAGAGASQVYVNDREPLEIKEFKKKLEKSDLEFSDRFKILEGDCFVQVKTIPSQSIDVVIVRNFVHFLKPSQYEEFFQLIKNVLKKDGIFFVTGNSSQILKRSIESPKEDMCYFRRICLVLYEPYRSPILLGCVYSELSEITETFDPMKNINTLVAEKTLRRGWITHFDTLSKKVKDFIESPELLEIFKNLSSMSFLFKIECRENDVVMFSPQSLGQLMENHGFHIYEAFSIDDKGHCTREDDPNITTTGIFASLGFAQK
jgi:ubiquinone/menaquinone biosynthesis C-methylase UbiE